jgi:hypothetical protein
MAVQPGRNSVQRRWSARRSLPNRYLARYYRRTKTVLAPPFPAEDILEHEARIYEGQIETQRPSWATRELIYVENELGCRVTVDIKWA